MEKEELEEVLEVIDTPRVDMLREEEKREKEGTNISYWYAYFRGLHSGLTRVVARLSVVEIEEKKEK